jgi:hypothetical protein
MAKVKQRDLIKEKLELYKSNPSYIMKQKGLSKAEYENEIVLMEQQLERSKRGKSSRNKGSSYERTIAKKFKDSLGVELTRTPQSGGFAKSSTKGDDFRGDIVSLDDTIEFLLHIECKDHSSWSLPAWIKQAEEDCPEGRIPVVIYHRRQKNEEGKRVQDVGDYVSIPLEMFLQIVDKSKIIIPKAPKNKVLRKKVKK